jgi:hypothetical protein
VPAVKRSRAYGIVFVQAATAIAKITDDFVSRVQGLEVVLARRSNDTKCMRELAKAYDEYAYTGVLDEGEPAADAAR